MFGLGGYNVKNLTIASGAKQSDAVATESWHSISFYVPNTLTYLGDATTRYSLQGGSGLSDNFYDIYAMQTSTGSTGIDKYETLPCSGGCIITFPDAVRLPYVKLQIQKAPPSGSLPVVAILKR